MFLQPFSFLGASAGTSAVNPAFDSLDFASASSGTPDTLTATYDYGGFDTLAAYIATRNGGTALTALQLVNDEGTYLERVVIDPFSVAEFDLSSFTATSAAATRVDMVIAEKNNGGFSTVQTVAVSGFDFTADTITWATNAAGNTITGTIASGSLYFSEDTADWAVSGAASTPSVTGVTGSGTGTITLALSASIVNGETITLAYTDSDTDLRDQSGNTYANFSGTSVTNNVPASGVDFTDVFTGSDSTEYLVSNSDYVLVSGSIPGVTNALANSIISTNRLTTKSGNSLGSFVFYDGDTVAADQFAEFDVVQRSSGGSVELLLRGTDWNNCYRLIVTSAGAVFFNLRNGGSGSDRTPNPPSAASATTIRVEFEGTTVRIYYDGVLQQTYTGQTVHSTGKVGFGISNGAVSATLPIIDNFRCGDL